MTGIRHAAAKGGLIAALAAAGFGIAAPQASAVTLKFSAFTPATNPIFKCSIVPVLAGIEKDSGGRIKFETYLGGSAFGHPVRQYDQAKRGVMDMTFGVLTYKQGAFPLTELSILPFVVDDFVSGTGSLYDMSNGSLKKELGDVKWVNLWFTSPYQLHMRKPIDNLTKMNGLRLRVSGRYITLAFKKLGAQAVSMPSPATYENLQKGVIDGTAATWTTSLAFRVGEVVNRHYVIDMAPNIGFTAMNKKSYASLPDDLKKVVDKYSGRAASIKVAECFRKFDKVAEADARKRGNTIIVVPKAERAKMRDAIQPVIDEVIVSLDKRGLPGKAVFAEMKKTFSKD